MKRFIKKLIPLIILVLIVMGIALTANRNIIEDNLTHFEIEYGKYKPKLMLVEDSKNGNKMYLFGSIHIGVEEMYPLPQEVLDAFNSSDVLAVETDIIELEKDYMLAVEMLDVLTYKDGTTLKDHISKEDLESFKSIAEKYGVLVDENSMYKPVFYSMVIQELMIEDTKYSTDYGVDRHLLTQAKEKGMKIIEVEDAIDTYKILGDLSEKTQRYLVYDTIMALSENESETFEELEILYKSWVNGTIEEYLAEYEQMEDYVKKAGYEENYYEYYKALGETRDNQMVKKAIEYLDSKDKYFFVVGAMHIESETGIIKQLKEKGYKVEMVIY